MASTPTVVVEQTFGITEAAVQLGTGLLGVAGGLAVYFLGQRSARTTEREEASIRAAGDLLVHVHLTREAWEARWNLRGRSGQSSDDAWAGLRLATVTLAPRLTDSNAREQLFELVAARLAFVRKDYAAGVEEQTERDRLWQEAMADLEARLVRAEAALEAYLLAGHVGSAGTR